MEHKEINYNANKERKDVMLNTFYLVELFTDFLLATTVENVCVTHRITN